MIIQVYSDGSATQKHLPGGYGWVLVIDGIKHSEGNGHIPQATNNDAEMEAAIHGLAAAFKYTTTLPTTMTYPDMVGIIEVTLISDSQIVLNWCNGTYKFKQESKYERFTVLKSLMERLNAKTQWIRGHSGNEHNERCDQLANEARLGPKPPKPPRKPRKESRFFKWNESMQRYDSKLSDSEILKNYLNTEHTKPIPLDSLVRIMIELMEIEEARKK